MFAIENLKHLSFYFSTGRNDLRNNLSNACRKHDPFLESQHLSPGGGAL